MAKVHRIEKSRKEVKCSKCGKMLPVGSAYLKATPFHRNPILRCTSCGLESWETSGSDYTLTLAPIVLHWSRDYDLTSAKEDIYSDLEDLHDECEDRLDNMPEQLQDSESGMILHERIEALEDAMNELDNIADYDDIFEEEKDNAIEELGDWDDEDVQEEFETKENYEEKVNERAEELAEERVESEIDEALSNLEY